MISLGVGADLARERASRISNLRYAIRLTIPSATTQPIVGNLTITFSMTGADTPLALDFAPGAAGHLHDCEANGSPMALTIDSEHVMFPADALREGPNILRLAFTAGDAPFNRRDDYLYSIFVPARAREAFPCFDQPDLKARWTLTLDIDGDWLALSNARQVGRRPVPDADGASRAIVDFGETEPIPPYLFACAAGRFEEDAAKRDGQLMRLYYRAADRDLLAFNRDAVFDAHGEARRWLEAYTAIPYPFGKLDILLLPDFQFSGMEHPGAIFYSAPKVLLPPSATRQHLLARASLIAHETAHMWFGDLVTMTWFDDVWMKEVFANFMAAKIVHPQFADIDHDLAFLHTHYPAAYDVDRTAGANAIRQPLANLNEAGSLYGPIIYLKSPIVMRQLEILMGEVALRDALRDYLGRHCFANASWPDLLAALAPRCAFDVRAWSRDWINEAGRPVVHTELTIEDGSIRTLSLCTATTGDGRRLTWPQRLDVTLGYGPDVQHVPVWLDGRADDIDVHGRPAPDYVLPNGRGLGYGEFHLSEASRDWLTRHLPDVADDVTRGAAWLALWDGMLSAEVSATALVDLAIRALNRETSELNVQRILSDLERLFWIFQADDQRRVRAPDVEAVLRSSLDAAGTTSLKAAIFACLRAIATTGPTIEWLQMLWAGEAEIQGLPLDEIDRIALASELAIRLDEAGDDIVRRQLAATRSPDRRDALAFVAPALSLKTRDRDRFFATIADAAHRRREPWVVDGLRWLHHPLRTDSAIRYIEPGLQLLEDVRRTGDIFLPRRWLDATLSGHRSADAAQIVRAFVETRPAGFPLALRRMVLASADYLFHASSLIPDP